MDLMGLLLDFLSSLSLLFSFSLLLSAFSFSFSFSFSLSWSLSLSLSDDLFDPTGFETSSFLPLEGVLPVRLALIVKQKRKFYSQEQTQSGEKYFIR